MPYCRDRTHRRNALIARRHQRTYALAYQLAASPFRDSARPGDIHRFGFIFNGNGGKFNKILLLLNFTVLKNVGFSMVCRPALRNE